MYSNNRCIILVTYHYYQLFTTTVIEYDGSLAEGGLLDGDAVPRVVVHVLERGLDGWIGSYIPISLSLYIYIYKERDMDRSIDK